MNRNLCVAYACDDNYIEQTGISIISLLENNSEFENIDIYFIDMGLMVENRLIVTNIVNKYNRKIVFVSFKDIAWDLNVIRGERHINSVYAKIFFSRIDDDMSKILYLDSDTVISGSLMELWNKDLNGKTIGAVKTKCKNILKKELGLKPSDTLINDGIVLLDLDKWRKNNYLNKCLDVINEFAGKPPILSEGVINKVLYNDIYYLEPTYNTSAILFEFSKKELDVIIGTDYYDEAEIINAKKNHIIIHYAGNTHIRPWFKNSDYPLCEYYDKFKSISVWKNVNKKNGKLSYKIKTIRFLHKWLPSFIWLGLYLIKNKEFKCIKKRAF